MRSWKQPRRRRVTHPNTSTEFLEAYKADHTPGNRLRQVISGDEYNVRPAWGVDASYAEVEAIQEGTLTGKEGIDNNAVASVGFDKCPTMRLSGVCAARLPWRHALLTSMTIGRPFCFASPAAGLSVTSYSIILAANLGRY